MQEGTDQRYGARHLKRAIERHMVYPLANLLATGQVHLGDILCIDWNKTNEGLSFVREGENLAMPARRAEPAVVTRAAQARSGKSVEAPTRLLDLNQLLEWRAKRSSTLLSDFE